MWNKYLASKRRQRHENVSIVKLFPKNTRGDIPQRIAGDSHDSSTRAVRFRVSGLIPKGDWSRPTTKDREGAKGRKRNKHVYRVRVWNAVVENIVRNTSKNVRACARSLRFSFNGHSLSTHQRVKLCNLKIKIKEPGFVTCFHSIPKKC